MSLLRLILNLLISIPLIAFCLFVLAWLIELLHEVTGFLLKYIRLIEEQIESSRRLYPFMKEQRKKKRKENKEKILENAEFQREFIDRQRALRKENEKRNKGNTK